MVGQHIYMRCLNEQKNAGTWTAAISEGAANRDILLQHIEPKCTLEETFAKNNMVSHPGNSVLRIYHAEGRTVVSRTYWEKDIVTEKEGRRGAYCHGFILTEKEDRAFNSDFEGAFDESCFDPYANVAARANANAGVVVLEPTLDIFRHKSMTDANRGTLEACGFDREKFTALMTGLYAAVREKKQLAVILPKEIRDAWALRGDKTTEKLAFVILGLLPDHIRYAMGLVSHWSCRLGDNMTSGMNLVFVHPEAPADLAELKKSDCLVLDMEAGTQPEAGNTDNSFFSFVWDHVDQKELPGEFWTYVKQNYLEILKTRPADPTLPEAVFLLREAESKGYEDNELNRLAFRKAGMALADAGGAIPAFDRAIIELMTKLEIGETSLTKDQQIIISNLVKKSKNASYTEKLYRLLLEACEAGVIEPGCLDVMCDELRKRGSVSDVLLTDFFRKMSDLPEEEMPKETVYALAIRLFSILVKGGVFGKGNFTLEAPLKGCLIRWSDRAIAEKDTRRLSQLIEGCSCYLEREMREDEDLVACIYRSLNTGLLSADETLCKRCEELLMKEEKSIYNGKVKVRSSVGVSELFAECVSRTVDAIEKIRSNKEAIAVSRAFRLAFFEGEEGLGVFADVYRRFVDRDAEQFFKAEESTLTDIRKVNAIWSRQKVKAVLSVLERINSEVLEHYIPKQQRFDQIITWFDRADLDLAETVLRYIGGLNRAMREAYLSILDSHGLLNNLLPYLFFADTTKVVFSDAVGLLNAGRREILVGIFHASSGREGEKFCTDEEMLERFEEWYREELEADRRAQMEFAEDAQGDPKGGSEASSQLAFLLEEMKTIREAPNHETAYGRRASFIVREKIGEIMKRFRPQDFAVFPHEMLQQLKKQLAPSWIEEKGPLSENPLFSRIAAADTAMLSGDLRTLDEVIAGASTEEENAALQYRMNYYSEKLARTNREKRVMVNTIAEAYFAKRQNALFYSKTYQAQEDEAKVGLLLNVIRDFVEMSQIKRPCIEACMQELHRLSESSPKLFNDEGQRNFYLQLKGDQTVLACVRNGVSNEFDRRKRNNGGKAFSIENISICILTSLLTQAIVFMILEVVF